MTIVCWKQLFIMHLRLYVFFFFLFVAPAKNYSCCTVFCKLGRRWRLFVLSSDILSQGR